MNEQVIPWPVVNGDSGAPQASGPTAQASAETGSRQTLFGVSVFIVSAPDT